MTYHEIGLGINPSILSSLGIGTIDILGITLGCISIWLLHRKWKYNYTWKQVLLS